MGNLDKALLNRLEKLMVETGALQFGEFILSSGAKSTYYMDGRKVSYHPEGAYVIGQLVNQALDGTGAEAVGGLTMGADPIAVGTGIVSYQKGKPIAVFSVRKEPKEHGTRRLIEGSLPEKPGVKVAIVDDTMTTGASMAKAASVVEEAGCKVVKIIAIVDRMQGGVEALRNKGYDVQVLLELDKTGKLRPTS